MRTPPVVVVCSRRRQSKSAKVAIFFLFSREKRKGLQKAVHFLSLCLKGGSFLQKNEMGSKRPNSRNYESICAFRMPFPVTGWLREREVSFLFYWQCVSASYFSSKTYCFEETSAAALILRRNHGLSENKNRAAREREGGKTQSSAFLEEQPAKLTIATFSAPDRYFHKFKGSKPINRRILYRSNISICGFWGSEFLKVFARIGTGAGRREKAWTNKSWHQLFFLQPS